MIIFLSYSLALFYILPSPLRWHSPTGIAASPPPTVAVVGIC